MRPRRSGQSLVELGLLAPVLIMLLLIVLDVGRAFAAWVPLHNAAREGAYLAATRFAGETTEQAIRDAVAGEAGEIGVLADPTYVVIANPSPDVVEVTARYPFQPVAPLVNSLWGGDTLWLSAKAVFPIAAPTTTPGGVAPTTPTPSATAAPTPTVTTTATLTPTATATPTLTPTATATSTPTATNTPSPTAPATSCSVPLSVPPLPRNAGYYATLQTAASGTIGVTWTLPRNNVSLSVYAGNPFAGQPNPVAMSEPSGALVSDSGNVTSLSATTGTVAAGTYSVYFYNRGSAISSDSSATLSYVKATCP